MPLPAVEPSPLFQLPAPPPVSAERFYSKMLAFCHGQASKARVVSKTEIWDAVDAAKVVYGSWRKAVQAPEAGKDKNFVIDGQDMADHVDEMAALIVDLLLSSDELFRLESKPGATQEQADLTLSVQLAALREKDFQGELRKTVARWLKFRYGGLKVCRTCETKFATERVDVPRDLYVDEILLARGFMPEQLQDGTALKTALAEDGYTFQGLSDESDIPGPNGEPQYTMILCTRTFRDEREYVYLESISPRLIAISDINRRAENQHTIHEYRYLTIPEMRRSYYKNLDKLSKLQANTSPTHQPGGTSSTDTAPTTTNLEFPVYEMVDTWTEAPIDKWIEDGDVTIEEVKKACEENGFPYTDLLYPIYGMDGTESYVTTGAKVCFVHYQDQCWNKFYSNYLLDKSEFPHDTESFVYDEDRFCAQGMMERMSSFAAMLYQFRNMTARCMRRQLNQSRIVSKRLNLTPEELKPLDEEGGTVMFNGQAVDLQQDLKIFEVPDVTDAGFKFIDYCEMGLRRLSVPAVLAGEADSKTATQDVMNNRRGQTVVNESFSRLVKMIKRSLRKHLGAVLVSFTRSRNVEILGEDGMTISNRWIRPCDLTDKIEHQMLVDFNDANKAQQAQFLLSLVNVFAPMLMPPEIRAMLEVCMRLGKLSRQDVQKIEQSLGSLTNAQQEVEAMLIDSDLKPHIRMDDPHPICIFLAEQALGMEMQKAMATGMPPPPRDNIIQYIETHKAMDMQMKAIAAMQQPEQAAGPKGKPKQEPKDGPSGEEGNARKEAQQGSPADGGIQSPAGMTGMAMSNPKMAGL